MGVMPETLCCSKSLTALKGCQTGKAKKNVILLKRKRVTTYEILFIYFGGMTALKTEPHQTLYATWLRRSLLALQFSSFFSLWQKLTAHIGRRISGLWDCLYKIQFWTRNKPFHLRGKTEITRERGRKWVLNQDLEHTAIKSLIHQHYAAEDPCSSKHVFKTF